MAELTWDDFFQFVLQHAILIIVSVLAAIALIIFAFLNKQLHLIDQWIYKVDKKCTRNGGELVGEVLKAHGIKFVFTLCGGHISPVLVACERLGIRVIDVRHEVTTIYAADAVARMSGVVGVGIVTAGPGVTNTITAIKNAQMAESPVLLIGGAAATLLKGRGSLQDIDQMSLFKPLCKYTATVEKVREIVPTLRRAIYEAASGIPGPVFVELPIDILYSYPSVSTEFVGKSSDNGLLARLLRWYLLNHVNGLFAGAFTQRNCEPIPPKITMPSNRQIQSAVEIVSRAKKPVILLGSQTTLPPVPANDVKTALESLGIPCFLGGMSRGLLGRKNPIHIRQQRRQAVHEADVVILAGAVCDFRLNYGRILNKKSKIIAVNRNIELLYLNSPAFWSPTVGIEGDVGTFVLKLCDRLKGYKCPSDWLETLRQRDAEKENKNLEMAKQPTTQHLNPIKVLYQLEECLDDNSILVADGGDFVGTAAYVLRPRGPLTWLDPGPFGTLGVGGGFALGAKLCRPDAEVWIIYGDGSSAYSIAEFDTCYRHKAPVLAIIGNDAAWSQIKRDQVPLLGSGVACDLLFSDYHTIAKGYGGVGFRIDSSNGDEAISIIKQAQAAAKEGKPAVLNVLVGRTKFREGSISI
ncbi:Acetolactate synthase-like protein [Trichoplax sp. H2]|nr:Acetolactate synthase-like protein [Trichoplax sp. H2]|eukprot:RDD44703.1 Acetolactate synthase-like protein [Trichoplax sp. H2]